jgi:hypothetical protein
MKNEEAALFERRVNETIPAVEEVTTPVVPITPVIDAVKEVVVEEIKEPEEKPRELPSFGDLQTIPFGGSPKRKETFEREVVLPEVASAKESTAGSTLGDVLRNVLEHNTTNNNVTRSEVIEAVLSGDPIPDFSMETQEVAEEGPGFVDKAMFGDDDDFLLPDTDELRNEVNEIIASAQKQDPNSTLIDFVGEASEQA